MQQQHALLLEKLAHQRMEIDQYKQQLADEKTALPAAINDSPYPEIVGNSAAMHKIYRLIATVAPSPSTVLILGETGTGKELIARAIHNNSDRKNKLLVKVNCAALPANLIESELFGHERGAFTGAVDRRLGKFEVASGGTLFLDEIGEMPLDLQVKLLRALQEKEIERVGSNRTIKVDVRIIAATNRDLEKEVQAGRFRRDLYYRLNIFPMHLPALRERPGDIGVLATHFIHRFAAKAGKQISTLPAKTLQNLQQYNWPGNIRELEHFLERSVLLSHGNQLKNLPLPSNNHTPESATTADADDIKTMDEMDRAYIFKVLKYCKGRIGGCKGAAELLGLPPSTLFSRMKKLGIERSFVQTLK